MVDPTESYLYYHDHVGLELDILTLDRPEVAPGGRGRGWLGPTIEPGRTTAWLPTTWSSGDMCYIETYGCNLGSDDHKDWASEWDGDQLWLHEEGNYKRILRTSDLLVTPWYIGREAEYHARILRARAIVRGFYDICASSRLVVSPLYEERPAVLFDCPLPFLDGAGVPRWAHRLTDRQVVWWTDASHLLPKKYLGPPLTCEFLTPPYAHVILGMSPCVEPSPHWSLTRRARRLCGLDMWEVVEVPFSDPRVKCKVLMYKQDLRRTAKAVLIVDVTSLAHDEAVGGARFHVAGVSRGVRFVWTERSLAQYAPLRPGRSCARTRLDGAPQASAAVGRVIRRARQRIEALPKPGSRSI